MCSSDLTMKLKELESYLSQCEPFTKPKVELEQYPTTSHIASRMLYAAQDDIKGNVDVFRAK